MPKHNFKKICFGGDVCMCLRVRACVGVFTVMRFLIYMVCLMTKLQLLLHIASKSPNLVLIKKDRNEQ